MNFAYKETAERVLKQINRTDLDPGHVVGLLRADHATLDHLEERVFVMYAKTVADYVDGGNEHVVENLAQCYNVPTRKMLDKS